MSGAHDDWTRLTWADIQRLASAPNESPFVEGGIASVLGHLRKALTYMTDIADKQYALTLATPHLEEAARIMKNVRKLKEVG